MDFFKTSLPRVRVIVLDRVLVRPAVRTRVVANITCFQPYCRRQMAVVEPTMSLTSPASLSCEVGAH